MSSHVLFEEKSRTRKGFTIQIHISILNQLLFKFTLKNLSTI